MPTSEPKSKVIATLTLVVEYEELPDNSEIEDVLDKAREVGYVQKASFTVLRAVTKELA